MTRRRGTVIASLSLATAAVALAGFGAIGVTMARQEVVRELPRPLSLAERRIDVDAIVVETLAEASPDEYTIIRELILPRKATQEGEEESLETDEAPAKAEEPSDVPAEASVAAPEPASPQAPPEASATQAAPAAEPELPMDALPQQAARVRTKVDAAGLDVRIETGGPVTYRAYSLSNPDRFVVDVSGSFEHKGSAIFRPGYGAVKNIRVGSHPDRFRVVFDLAQALDRPAISATDSGLEITYAPGTARAE